MNQVTQFILPQAVISNGEFTGNPWQNPDNLLLIDNDVANSQVGQVASDVVLGNYNLNIPSNATILGIELTIFAYRGAQTSPVISLTPYALDDTDGSNHLYAYDVPLTDLTPDLATYVLGSPTYLFDTTWTPDQINNFKLQLLTNGAVYVDSALVKVYYSVPDAPTPPDPDNDFAADGNAPIQAQPFILALDMEPGDRYGYLESFNYVTGDPIVYADLGSAGGFIDLTFDPGLDPVTGNGNFEENLRTASWAVQPNGQVKLDFGASLDGRGLDNKTPYGPDASLRSGHNAGAKVIISNNAPFMSRFLRVQQLGYVFNGPVEIDNQGTKIDKAVVKLNFTGSGVTASTDGEGNITIEIDGFSGTVTVNGVQTLTNKRITKRFVSITEVAAPAIDTDNVDIASIVALSQNITSMTTNLTGTPVAGDYLMVQITDDGTPRTIAWGSKFQSTTGAVLPVTTVTSTLLRVGFQWNAVASKWDCIAVD